MGWNLSHHQVSHELGLHKNDAQRMTEPRRTGIDRKQTPPELSGEADEVDVIAGHPEAVREQGRKGRRHRRKGPVGVAPWPRRRHRFSA
jgi:hypothetical protein